MKLNRFHKNGSVSLSGDYLAYRKDGGNMSPEVWNSRVKELRKESSSTSVKRTEERE